MRACAPGSSKPEMEWVRQFNLIALLAELNRPVDVAEIRRRGVDYGLAQTKEMFDAQFGHDRDGLAWYGILFDATPRPWWDSKQLVLPKANLYRGLGRLTKEEWAALRDLALRADDIVADLGPDTSSRAGAMRAAIWRMALLARPSHRGKSLATELFKAARADTAIVEGAGDRFGRLATLMAMLTRRRNGTFDAGAICRLLGVTESQLGADLELINQIRTADGVHALSAGFRAGTGTVIAARGRHGDVFARPLAPTPFELSVLARAARREARGGQRDVMGGLAVKFGQLQFMASGSQCRVAEYVRRLPDGTESLRCLGVRLTGDRMHTTHSPHDHFDVRSDPDSARFLALEREVRDGEELAMVLAKLRELGGCVEVEVSHMPFCALRQMLEAKSLDWA